MTIAVAKAIMETEKRIKPLLYECDNNNDYYSLLETMTIKYMQEIGRKYPPADMVECLDVGFSVIIQSHITALEMELLCA